MTWTEERVNILREMWVRPECSASTIAEYLGGISRNAVIGKVHRLGLSAPARTEPSMTYSAIYRREHRKGLRRRNQGYRPERNRRRNQTYQLNPLKQRKKHVREVKMEYPAEPIAAFRPCSLMELTPTTCRWPYGDPGKPDFHFCGGFVWDKTYCKHHHAMAYSPEKPRTPWVPMRRAA
jgi:GcrA cell cycle regulator